VFGLPSTQQLALVRAMVADLNLPVRIDGAPLIRDADGLALSSRNAYLTAEQRVAALALPRALQAGVTAAVGGAAPREIVAAARDVLESERGLETDYVALIDPDTFDDLDPSANAVRQALLAVAGRVGSTRLIDNESVDISESVARENR
jgi:pantoate--beta-alanine ligase